MGDEEELVGLHPMGSPCLLWGRTICPLPVLNLFWKVAIVVTAILMLSFATTLWLMAQSMSHQATEIRELRQVMTAGDAAIVSKIEGHKQMTMENRHVTAEIKGMVTSLLAQHESKDKK
jgi:hypothetical protein